MADSVLVPVTLDTVLRCKICSNAKRREIDLLIAAQRSGEFNRDELLVRIGALGVENPNVDNVKLHCGTEKQPKHVKFVTQEDLEETRQVLEDEMEKMAAGDFEAVDPDQLLQLQLKAYQTDLLRRIAAGEDVHLTHDHAIKIVSEMTKRRHNQAQQEILGALTGGIVQALGRSEEFKQLDAGEEIVDVEAVEVEEGEPE